MHVRQAAHAFILAGQRAWFHDEGFAYGPVHTYDALRLPGPDPRARKAHVLVPWSYGDGARYPVVYMNDGQTALFPGGLAKRGWQVAQTLGQLLEQGRIPPVIVVALHPIERDAEYTHAPTFPGRPYGGLETYARHVAEAVKPWVDSAYLTQPERDRSVMLGSSHGGLAAFYTGCRYPDRFGRIGALSPSFWVGRGANGGSIRSPLETSELLDRTRATLQDHARRPKIWIDWGLSGDGSMRGAQQMAALLPRAFGYELGRDLWVHEDPIGGHNEEAWSHRFGLVMEAFFGTQKP
jgi:predicted alpha/beta superfamily hydrolase